VLLRRTQRFGWTEAAHLPATAAERATRMVVHTGSASGRPARSVLADLTINFVALPAAHLGPPGGSHAEAALQTHRAFVPRRGLASFGEQCNRAAKIRSVTPRISRVRVGNLPATGVTRAAYRNYAPGVATHRGPRLACVIQMNQKDIPMNRYHSKFPKKNILTAAKEIRAEQGRLGARPVSPSRWS
jgi:hypothetical protein